MAMMGDEPVFLDTNVLVYASIAEAPSRQIVYSVKHHNH